MSFRAELEAFACDFVRLQMLWDNQRYLERRLWLVWSEIRRLSTDVAIVAV
jgi:hypothetical protein